MTFEERKGNNYYGRILSFSKKHNKTHAAKRLTFTSASRETPSVGCRVL